VNDIRKSAWTALVEWRQKVAYDSHHSVNSKDLILNLSGLFFQLGLTVIFVGLAAAGIFWAIKSGQYDDFDGPAQRILMDDDDPMIPFNEAKVKTNKIEPNQEKAK
jgi:cbb3-type cytochrome oxidase maturation protein